MRQITVTTPRGRAREVAEIAFAVGISQVTIAEKRVLSASGSEVTKDSIEMEVGTPLAKAFMDEFTSQPFFIRDDFSIAVRQPRAIISQERLKSLTRPLVEPSVDLFEELWQISQVTYDYVGRILIGALLLAYGLVEYKLLLAACRKSIPSPDAAIVLQCLKASCTNSRAYGSPVNALTLASPPGT